VPLYVAILFKVMKEKTLHEDCISNIDRLFRTRLFTDGAPRLDDVGRLRVDDWELREDVQAEVRRRWESIQTENVMDLSDLDGFRRDFLRIFGFEVEGVDYDADVVP
jgi:enoyl-[acyl-carrier protein] reductase/trans-2-enoyl-CoA reductase (NAD+)